MSSLQRNFLASFGAKGWSSLMSLIFIPLYIQFIGMESYALIGFFVTLQAVFSLLDMGLSTTLNREIARLSAHPDKAGEARDLVRTLEMIYWIGAGVIAVIVMLLAPFMAHNWVNPQHLSASVVQQAVLLMGFAMALNFPFALYTGGLLGLQQQVLLGGLLAAMATLRGLGAVGVLWLVSPTIQAFFCWQICVSFTQTMLGALLLWRNLQPAGQTPRFRRNLLLGVWRFAAGMTGISVATLLLTQLDKLLLSKLLPLEMFGYYNLATAVASALYLFAGPFFSAIFPRFSQLVSIGDEAALQALYHRSCQMMSVLLLPLAVVAALFAPEVLWIWTGNTVVVQRAHLLVSLLIVGTALHGLSHIPYALQLAHGWTRLPFYQNVVAVILLVPLLLWTTARYGAVGAAGVWITLNAGYIVIGIQVMHRRLLKDQLFRWYYQDVGLPLTGALGVALLGRYLFPGQASVPVQLSLLAVIFLGAALAAVCATPLRPILLRSVARQFV